MTHRELEKRRAKKAQEDRLRRERLREQEAGDEKEDASALTPEQQAQLFAEFLGGD